jgi:hypothetical protein
MNTIIALIFIGIASFGSLMLGLFAYVIFTDPAVYWIAKIGGSGLLFCMWGFLVVVAIQMWKMR